jgi:hypothetical protein
LRCRNFVSQFKINKYDVLINRELTSDWDVIMSYHNKENDVLIDRVLTSDLGVIILYRNS